MHEFFKSDEFFNFELLRILGATATGGCDAAEFVDAVGEIKSGDAESWYRAWLKQAEKAERIAAEAQGAGLTAEARKAFLRASNYFRASQYMMFDKPRSPDPRVVPLCERSVDNFVKAAELLDMDIRQLQIDHDGYKLPGYLYLPSAAKRVPGKKLPIVIVTAGADSSQEEMYHWVPCAGPDLGYAVLTFEGPGQGMVLRRQKIFQRPDWEVVTSAVLDHIFSYAALHPDLELDTDRIATCGASLGGYHALRGASDSRVKACVATDAFYDMWDLVTARMPPGFVSLWTAGWIPDWFVDRITMLQNRFAYQSHWEFQCSSWIMGADRPVDLLRKMREFTFRLPGGGEFLERVNCPVFVTGAAHSIYFDPSLSVGKIMSKMQHIPEAQKKTWVPKEPADGGLQGKVGAWQVLRIKTFQFLDQQFGIVRDKP